MSDRIPCKICGALILQATSDRTHGKCMPCHDTDSVGNLIGRPGLAGALVAARKGPARLSMLHCPKCRTSQEVDFEVLNFRFVRYAQTGSIREFECPKCGFFIPGRNAMSAATMEEAVERQRKFEELLKQQ